MSLSADFRTFCSELTVDTTNLISQRYHAITRRLNRDFWGTESETNHSLYVGSYGRDTAIRGVSDIDMIFRLPYSVYERYDSYLGNGQSALLQAVKNSILRTYSTTDVGGDGQVVVVRFSSMRFEVVPAFVNKDDSFTYPDSNNGGRWRITDPRPEISAVNETNNLCNLNLKRLCRMARAWKDEHNVPMGGLLIDTLANSFLRNWAYRQKSYTYYDWMARDFFNSLANQDPNQSYWRALGSGQYIYRKGNFEYKAKQARNLAQEAIDCQLDAVTSTRRSRLKWREIFGDAYPV